MVIVRIVLNELPYNAVTRAVELEVGPFCAANGIGVMGYSSLAQGLLTGKYLSADSVPEMRARTRHFRGDRPSSRHGGPGCEELLFASVQAIKTIAERLGVTMSDLAIAYCVAKPFISTVLVGARNTLQMEENCRAGCLQLSPDVVREIDDATAAVMAALGPTVDMYESVSKSRTY